MVCEFEDGRAYVPIGEKRIRSWSCWSLESGMETLKGLGLRVAFGGKVV